MGKSKKKKKSDRRKPAPVKHFTQEDVFLALFNGGDPREDDYEEEDELPENYRIIWSQMANFRSVAKGWIPLEDLEALEQRKEAMVREIRELLKQRLLEREALKKKLISQARRRTKSEDGGAVVMPDEPPEKSQWEALLESLGGLFGHNREVMIAEGLIAADEERPHGLGRVGTGVGHRQMAIVTEPEVEDSFGPETLPGIHGRMDTAPERERGSSFLTEEDEKEAESLSDQFRRQPSQIKVISRKPSFASPVGLGREMSFADYGVEGAGAAAGGVMGRDRSYSSGLGGPPPDSPEVSRSRSKSSSKDGTKHSHAPVTSKANQEAKLLILTSDDYLPSLWAGLLKKPERAKVAALARFRLAELARKEREEAEAKAIADAAAAQALLEEEERRMKEEAEEQARLEREALEAEAARRLSEEEEGAERARQLLFEIQAAREAEMAALAAEADAEEAQAQALPPEVKKSSNRKKSVRKVKKNGKGKPAQTAQVENSLAGIVIPSSRAESPELSVGEESSLAASSAVMEDDEDETSSVDSVSPAGERGVPFDLCQTRRLESRGGLATAPTVTSVAQVVDMLVEDWGEKYPGITKAMDARPPEEGPTMEKPRDLILQYVLGFNPEVNDHLQWYRQSLRSMFEAGESLDDDFNIQLGFAQGQFALAPSQDSMMEVHPIQVVISRPPTVDPSGASSRAQSTKKSREVLRLKSRDMSFRNDTAPSELDQESLIGLNPRYSPSHTAISADNMLYTRGGSTAGSDIAHSAALASSSVGVYSASLQGNGSYMSGAYSPARFSHGPSPQAPNAYTPAAANSMLREFYNFSDDAPLMDKIALDMEIIAAEAHTDVMEKLKLSQTVGRDSGPSPRSRSPRRQKPKHVSQEPGFAVPHVEPGGVNIFPELLAVSCDYSASGILTMTSVLSRYKEQGQTGPVTQVSTEHTDVLSFDGIRIPQPSPNKSRHRHLRKIHYQQASVAFNSTITDPMGAAQADRSSITMEHQKASIASAPDGSFSTARDGRIGITDNSSYLYGSSVEGVAMAADSFDPEFSTVPSHPYGRRARARSKSHSMDDGSDSDSVTSMGSYDRRKLSLHGVYFDIMSDGEAPDDHSHHSHGTERIALSNDTTLALLLGDEQRMAVQTPIVPFRPKNSFSSQSNQRRKRFMREKSSRALVKTMFTPYPIHKKGLDQKDIALEWDPLTMELQLVATFSKTVSHVPPAVPITTSILSSSLPRKSANATDGKEEQQIRISLADVQVTRASEVSRSVTENVRSISYSVSNVPFHYASYAYNQSVQRPQNDMLVLRSPKVPGEYITSIQAADFQQLLRDVENNIIVAAAVDAANASLAMTREARELDRVEQSPRPEPEANEFITVKQLSCTDDLPDDNSQHTPHIFIPRINADRLTPFSRGRSRGQSGRPKPALMSMDG